MNDSQGAILCETFGISPESRAFLACEALYELGKECPRNTAAVYLGAGKGLGVAALAYGCLDGKGASVVALDDDGNDAIDFVWNMGRAGVQHVQWKEVRYRREGRRCSIRAGLVVWDTGHGPELGGDFAAWASRIVEGGLFAVAGNRAAFPLLQERARKWCWLSGPKWYKAKVWTLRKCEYDDDYAPGRVPRRKGRPKSFR